MVFFAKDRNTIASVEGLRFSPGLGLRFNGLVFRLLYLGFRVLGKILRSGLGLRIWGLGFSKLLPIRFSGAGEGPGIGFEAVPLVWQNLLLPGRMLPQPPLRSLLEIRFSACLKPYTKPKISTQEGYRGRCGVDNKCAWAGRKSKLNYEEKVRKRGSKGNPKKRRDWWLKKQGKQSRSCRGPAALEWQMNANASCPQDLQHLKP